MLSFGGEKVPVKTGSKAAGRHRRQAVLTAVRDERRRR